MTVGCTAQQASYEARYYCSELVYTQYFGPCTILRLVNISKSLFTEILIRNNDRNSSRMPF